MDHDNFLLPQDIKVVPLERTRVVRLGVANHPVLLVTGHAHEQVASALDGLMLERQHPLGQ
jgi:hypothetical protein